MIRIEKPFIYIETKENLLVFEVCNYIDERTEFNKNRQIIVNRYYGLKENFKELEPRNAFICPHGSCDEYSFDFLISSTFGNGNNEEPSILLKNNDNTFVNRFFFKDVSILKGSYEMKGPHTRSVLETLDILEVDDVLNIELHHYYSIMEDSDCIVVKRRLVNKSKESFLIERLFSNELPIDSNDLTFYSYDGAWLYERNRHSVKLNNGMFYVDSKCGTSSHKHNPYCEVLDNKTNLIYGFNLVFSGNHKELVDVYNLGHSKFMNGINDFGFEYELKSNEEFITPESVMCVKTCRNCLANEMREFCLNHIVNPNFKNFPRPIIFNNWEGTGMKINEQSLLEMADCASYVGVEQFVMDDGWFKGRVDDHHALGDWVIDKEKFPNGLKGLSDKIREKGLKFGIWVEPEMISIDSDLYRLHPEYACIIPNREPIERRYQLMIDMSNPNVIDYLFENLSKVFSEVDADYVKWDYNRFMTDSYSNYGTSCGELLYKTVYGLYDLLERLTNKFPEILFEGCSSGGGRFDLGMFYYMPQTWGSDDTNTFCRTYNREGTLSAYPQSGFGAHVSVDYCPLPNTYKRASLEDRFNIHSLGAFGYEWDFRKFSKEELDVMKDQVSFYKEHRELLQYGRYYCVDSVFDDERYSSYTLVNSDKTEAIMVLIQMMPHVKSKSWKALGLDNNALYEVSIRPQANLKKSDIFTKVIKGSVLLEKGINIGVLDNTLDKDKFDGVFSRMLYLKKIK